ncbi:MAG: hydrogenase maturation protease [Armatimonadota bacterium]|nr:hydrogenase maturation protease [Armatimonadota bacterium]MDR5702344.1 hydrogenase maturation protease [Armatimonadota bacterium]
MKIRVVCLGNDLLADDAFGPTVGEKLQKSLPDDVEVITTSASGFSLLEEILGITHLLVVDTVLTGRDPPGTIFLWRDEEVQIIPGSSPHYVGLFEALELGRKLCLRVPDEVVILAIEAADCTTVGGPMHSDVQAAIPVAVRLAQEIVLDWWKRGRPDGASLSPVQGDALRVDRVDCVDRGGETYA